MLGHYHRLWTNITPTLIQCLLFFWLQCWGQQYYSIIRNRWACDDFMKAQYPRLRHNIKPAFAQSTFCRVCLPQVGCFPANTKHLYTIYTTTVQNCVNVIQTLSVYWVGRVFKWNESGFRPPLCTYRLNWARRTSWGWWDDWDDTVLQTQEHATSRSRRLPTILTFTRGWGRNIFLSFKPPRPGTEPRTLAWKAAVLTTSLGPPPGRVFRLYETEPWTRRQNNLHN